MVKPTGAYQSRLESERRSPWRRFLRSPLFEPVLAIIVIVVIVVSLYAYTETWPPMVVVESGSMQHGTNDVLGVINTGDIVLVKSVSDPTSIPTYVDSEVSGFTTYGEYGNVLLYIAHDAAGNVLSTVPIIHRAIVWLNYNGTGFTMPSVFALSCPSEYVVLDPVGVPGCLSNPWQPEAGTLVLKNVGWQSVWVNISLSGLLREEPYSGFVTMGDNNIAPGTRTGLYDQMACYPSCLVKPEWVVGVARGMIPWFGALKLWIEGQSCVSAVQCVPTQSWAYLGLSIAAIIILPQVVPWGYRLLRNRIRERQTKGLETPEASPPDNPPPIPDPPSEPEGSHR